MALRYRTAWLAAGAAFVALVIYLSLSVTTIDAGKIENVKGGHFLAYCWLMYWYSQLYRRLPVRIAIAAVLVAMGIGLEYLQGMTTYRTFGYMDMRDNALGVAVGLVLGSGVGGTVLARLERFYQRYRRVGE
jgi:hypothetical protein